MAPMRQGELRFHARGGRRAGAGRKPTGRIAGVPHCRRPIPDRRHPLHVTMRVRGGLPSLRSGRLFASVRCALAMGSRARFRIVHFTVQSNHVHLLVEAEGSRDLGRGMQGLGIRLAKTINGQLCRAGRVWADRYHCRALRTPREVRDGLVYVLSNGRKHHVSAPGLDPCSSASWFGGWRERIVNPAGPAPVAPARTWLLRIGWRKGGSIGMCEAPAGTG